MSDVVEYVLLVFEILVWGVCIKLVLDIGECEVVCCLCCVVFCVEQNVFQEDDGDVIDVIVMFIVVVLECDEGWWEIIGMV